MARGDEAFLAMVAPIVDDRWTVPPEYVRGDSEIEAAHALSRAPQAAAEEHSFFGRPRPWRPAVCP